MRPDPSTEHGFTLLDLIAVLGILSVLSAIGLPLLNTTTERLRLTQAARDVERELQGAKQRAVATNRPIRVRFNCPTTGIYRAVELIGTPRIPNSLDGNTARCDDATFPYPAADRDPITRPNVDGQVRRLPRGIAFGSVQNLEFWPDGTAHAEGGTGGTNPWPPIPSTGLTLTLTQASRTASIQVNGIGRITLATQ